MPSTIPEISQLVVYADNHIRKRAAARSGLMMEPGMVAKANHLPHLTACCVIIGERVSTAAATPQVRAAAACCPSYAAAKSQYAAAMDNAMTEQERLAVTLQMTDAQWEQKQEEMAHENRVSIPGQKHPAKKANIPAGEPPHGYICLPSPPQELI